MFLQSLLLITFLLQGTRPEEQRGELLESTGATGSHQVGGNSEGKGTVCKGDWKGFEKEGGKQHLCWLANVCRALEMELWKAEEAQHRGAGSMA